MSTAPVIDIRYRLRPEHIGRSGVYVTIQNVSWQGVEQLAPLLHLREFPTKRLLLDSAQQQALIHITGSSEPQAWVGQVLLLQIGATAPDDEARAQASPWCIQLFPPAQRAVTIARPRLPWLLSDNLRTTLILLLLLLLLFLAVTMLESSDRAWQWLLG